MLQELMNWYISHCDGEWEHGYGITIETLDNPGWAVKLTGASGKQDFCFKREEGERWVYIKTTASEFKGYGDEHSLIELLSMATKWISHNMNQ